MQISRKIAPCLWFASEAEEAARHYVGIFPDSKLGKIARYGKAGFETHGQKEGAVLTVQFEPAEPNEKSERAMTALLRMGKLDIAALERAYQGR
jgi:predicted 3-demethylubiquinone-9 3-methyltransferase (glyoxalase superfamily)